MGCGASSDSSISAHHHDMIKKFGKAINSKDWETVKSLISDNFEYANNEREKDNRQTPMTIKVNMNKT